MRVVGLGGTAATETTNLGVTSDFKRFEYQKLP